VEALEGRRPRLAIACLAVLLAAGAAARVHGLGRSLWLDEAWVANSLLAPGLAEMLRYEAWLQTNPPLFLILLRGTVALAGDGNPAFRVVPALFSLASLALFAALAWRWLRAPAALAAVALFALSPRAALAGASLKPYASDAFSSLALLAAGAVYLALPSGRRLAATLATASLLAALSFSAPLFLPALLLTALVPAPRGRRAPPSHAIAILATGAALALALQVLCVLPNRDESLLEYFRSGFFPGGGPAALLAWIGGRLRVLASFAPGVERAGPGELAVVALALLGIGDLVRRGVAGDARALAHGALLATPIAATLAVNLAGALPIARGNERVLAFLFPVVALAAGAGLDAFARAAASLALRSTDPRIRRRSEAPGWIALVALLAGIGVAASRGELRGLAQRPAEEDVEGAVAYLAREVARPDLLYVHSTMRESFTLYARRTPPAGRALLGEVDWPCCPRGRRWRRDEDPATTMPAELARISAADPRRGRLWVLVTDREGHFRQRGRRSPALLERWLAGLGCQRAATTGFRGVRVDRYQCGAGSSPGYHPAERSR
jgi:hypothetical protein